jgi:hypothetical protein
MCNQGASAGHIPFAGAKPLDTPLGTTPLGTPPDTPPDTPLGTPAMRPERGTGPLRNGNPRGNPNLAPRCGARRRCGGLCRAPAMPNGRCRIHGGKSTGPRTQEGMARMAAAHTTHGRYSESGAPKRAVRRFFRAALTRAALLAEATRLQAYLPREMAARLDQNPPELSVPTHPSYVAYAAAVRSGLGPTGPGHASGNEAECAGPRRGAGGGRAVPEARLTPLWRDAERTAALAEVAVRAPWRAAIAFAQAAKRAAREARARFAAAKARGPRSNPMERETAVAAAGLRVDAAQRGDGPINGSAGAPRPALESRLVELDLLYRERALRVAGLRPGSNGQPGVERLPDTVSASCDINLVNREAGGGPSLAEQPMGVWSPDAVSASCDIDPLKREAGGGPSLTGQPAGVWALDGVSTRCDIDPMNRKAGVD